jgi:hypothetical protein
VNGSWGSRSTAELVQVLARSGLDADRDLVEELVRRGRAAVPYLARILDEERYWRFDDAAGKGWAPISALHALAAIGDPEGLKPILRVLHRRPNDLDDWLTESIPSILASFGPSAVEPVKELVSNRYLDTYVRGAATGAFSLIAREHPESRGEIVDFLHKILLQEKEEDTTFLSFCVGDLAEIRDPTSRPIIHSLFDAQRIDEDIIDRSCVDDIYYRWTEDRLAQREDPMRFFSRENLTYLKQMNEPKKPEGEVETAASWFWPEPTGKGKLGRNDPCPCGSGKKYKKCCLPRIKRPSGPGLGTEEIRRMIGKWTEMVVLSETAGVDLSEEAEYVKDMLEEHPEYVEGFLSGGDRDGMNPRMHIFVESIIQRQIALNDPPEVREAHLALMKGPSLDAHEARHAIGAVFTGIIWHTLKENWPPDEIQSEYLNRLRELAKKRTRDEVWKDFET